MMVRLRRQPSPLRILGFPSEPALFNAEGNCNDGIPMRDGFERLGVCRSTWCGWRASVPSHPDLVVWSVCPPPPNIESNTWAVQRYDPCSVSVVALNQCAALMTKLQAALRQMYVALV